MALGAGVALGLGRRVGARGRGSARAESWR